MTENRDVLSDRWACALGHELVSRDRLGDDCPHRDREDGLVCGAPMNRGPVSDRSACAAHGRADCDDCFFAFTTEAVHPDDSIAELARLRVENGRLRETLKAIGPVFPSHHIDSDKGGRWIEYDDGDGHWDDGDVHTEDCPACALGRRIDEALETPRASDETGATE